MTALNCFSFHDVYRRVGVGLAFLLVLSGCRVVVDNAGDPTGTVTSAAAGAVLRGSCYRGLMLKSNLAAFGIILQFLANASLQVCRQIKIQKPFCNNPQCGSGSYFLMLRENPLVRVIKLTDNPGADVRAPIE